MGAVLVMLTEVDVSLWLPPPDPHPSPSTSSHSRPSLWMLPEEAAPGAGQREEADGRPPEGHEHHRSPRHGHPHVCVNPPTKPKNLTDTKLLFNAKTSRGAFSLETEWPALLKTPAGVETLPDTLAASKSQNCFYNYLL